MRVNLSAIRDAFPEFTNLQPAPVKGGQKIVLKAHRNGRPVALKIVRKVQSHPRIQREIASLQKLNHPAILPVLDFGFRRIAEINAFYIVEPWIDGTTLRAYLANHHTLNLGELLWLAEHLFDACAHLADHHLVHRDIKPENLMLLPPDRVILIDFGLVRVLDEESLTATGLFKGVGTVGYAPPEQFMNLKAVIDYRADLYAIAVVLAEAATGINPFRMQGPNPVRIMKAMKTSPIHDLDIPDDPDRRFSRLIEDLTRPSPAHRLSDFDQILQRLDEIKQKSGMQPAPPSLL